MEDILEMNKKGRERLKILVRLELKTLTQKIAAQQLGLSIRQIQRLFVAYQEKGESAVISKKRGRLSNNRLKNSLKDEVAGLISQNYPDFGPTFAQEKLLENHNIEISVSSVRNIMVKNSIWLIKKASLPKVYQRRAPRECLGELIQMDGSYHDWFEGRAPKCCLLVLIDDATSRIMGMRFVEWESCFGYFRVLLDYIKKHGKPLSVYTDRLAVFETTRKNDKVFKDTQFHRAMSTLGIRLILAHSPQAKGRVEKVNGTLQDRLIKEMRLARISSMEEGNAFLPSYITKHNKKFAKKPKSSINAHQNIDLDFNLENILCLHHKRIITKDQMVFFKGKTYQIIEEEKFRLGGQKVLILEKEESQIEFIYKNKSMKNKIYYELPKENNPNINKFKVAKESAAKRDISNWSLPRGGNPGRYHPWKSGKKRVWS